MENNSKKIFTNKAISAATFFGGPIAAGFLIAKNYKVFGNNNAARNSIFIGILFTLLLLVGLLMLPENVVDKIPQPALPAIYTAVIALLVERLQGKKIEDFLSNNGQKASNWQTAGYGFAGLLLIIVFLVISTLSIPLSRYPKTIKIENNVTLHYERKLDENKTQRLSQFIKQSGFMKGSKGADLLFSKESGCYVLKFIVADKTVISDSNVISNFNRFEKKMTYNLNFEKPIQIRFTDPTLQYNYELKEIDNPNPLEFQPAAYLMIYQINDFHTIYYNFDMPLEDVEIVGEAIKKLRSYFPDDRYIPIVFLSDGQDYTIKFFISKAFWVDAKTIERLTNTVKYIRSSGIRQNIRMVLIDPQTLEEE
jgi:hypothetical protein